MDGGGRPAGARCSAANLGAFNRWGNRRFPASEDPSCSPPKAFGGEQEGSGFAQPPGTRSSPSQGAAGHPLQRDREGLPRQRACLYAKNGSVKGSRPAINPSFQGDSGVVRSLFRCTWMPPFRPSSARSRATKAPRYQDASPHPHERSPRYAVGETADRSAALRRRRAPPLPARRRLGHFLRQAMFSVTQNGCTGCTLPGIRAAARPPPAPYRQRPERRARARRGREPRPCSCSGLLNEENRLQAPASNDGGGRFSSLRMTNADPIWCKDAIGCHPSAPIPKTVVCPDSPAFVAINNRDAFTSDFKALGLSLSLYF